MKTAIDFWYTVMAAGIVLVIATVGYEGYFWLQFGYLSPQAIRVMCDLDPTLSLCKPHSWVGIEKLITTMLDVPLWIAIAAIGVGIAVTGAFCASEAQNQLDQKKRSL